MTLEAEIVAQAKTQTDVRAAVTMGRWCLAHLEDGSASVLIDTIDTTDFQPGTLLGLLSILFTQRELVGDAWLRLALRTHEDLRYRPGWDTPRVQTAMSGLL